MRRFVGRMCHIVVVFANVSEAMTARKRKSSKFKKTSPVEDIKSKREAIETGELREPRHALTVYTYEIIHVLSKADVEK